jgi:tetratricopeptide (TPR) repeat protein
MAKNKKENLNPSKSVKHSNTTDLLENPDALKESVFGAEDFIKKNRNLLIGVASIILVAVSGYLVYTYIQTRQEQEAQEEMFPAVYYMEADSLNKAIEGDGNYQGFKSIIEDYNLSKSANLANFYTGVALLKKGEFEESISYLKKFNAGDLLVQARSYSLIGDAYMELNQFGEAIDYYKQASGYKANKFFTPSYLMKLALAYEKNEQPDEAIEIYARIIKEYPAADEGVNAKKYKAFLEAKKTK